MPVPAQERIPMPHRDRLERRFGRPLAGIPVYSGPQVARALADHGAVAATQDGCIFLADRAASLPVVVHEVVHVLQPLLRRLASRYSSRPTPPPRARRAAWPPPSPPRLP